MRNQTCCFTGHRFIPAAEQENIKLWLHWTIQTLNRKYGVKYFGAGGALGFDTMAAEAVLELRQQLGLKLIIIVPCRGQEARWCPADQDRYHSILQQADKVRILSDRYYDGCMLNRNRHMVDASAWCVSYCTKQSGGTAYTVKYAKEQGLELVNYPKKIFL